MSTISYGQIQRTTLQQAIDENQLFKNMGITYYSIHMSADPFIFGQNAKIQILDAAVAEIRSVGGRVHIVDAGAESYWNHKLTWEQMKTSWRSRVGFIAARYHPDVYTIIKEPAWYLGLGKISNTTIHELGWYEAIKNLSMVSNPEDITAKEVVNLSRELSRIVRWNSPTTKVLYVENALAYVLEKSVYGQISTRMLSKIVQDPNLDGVGIDIYGNGCGDDNITPALDNVVNIIRLAGKEYRIPETWATTADCLSTCSNLDQIEVTWAEHISGYAADKNAVVEWFFTQRFGSLQNPSSTYSGIREVMKLS